MYVMRQALVAAILAFALMASGGAAFAQGGQLPARLLRLRELLRQEQVRG